VDLIDHLWRDLDRAARTGARPLQLLSHPGTWMVATYRIGRALRRLPRLLRLPLLCAQRPWEIALGTFIGVALPPNAEIGGGMQLGDGGAIVVSPDAHIGRDCHLSQGVAIVEDGRDGDVGAPWIGDRVFIGPGAKVLGAIRVGNDAAIGANAVVNDDVPDGATVAGIPAKVVSMRGSKGLLPPGRRRPPFPDLLRQLVRGFLPRPTQLLLRA